MKQNNFPFFLILISLLLSACTATIDVEVPEQDPKLVICGFLCPQSDNTDIDVRVSKPIFSADDIDEDFQSIYSTLSTAIVTLSNGTAEITIPYDSNNYTYRIAASDFEIIPGVTYLLTVSAVGYKTVFATTTIPIVTPTISFADYYNHQPVSDGNQSNTQFNIKIQWQDVGLEKNYYQITTLEHTPNGDQYVKDNSFIMDDEHNNQLLEKTISFESYSNNLPEEAQFRIYLLNAEKDFYFYQRSTQNIVAGDPFSEPTIVYTNITNGLGCFSSYNGSSVVVSW